jgi:chromosome segregation ATPase
MFQWGSSTKQVDASSPEVQNGSSDDEVADPVGTPPPTETVTSRQHSALLEEVELINSEVTAVRKQLWETQDILKEKNMMIGKLNCQVEELLKLREKDKETVKELKEANTNLVEEEAKVREQLDLMKKVLTRSELKVKDYEETISILENSSARPNENHGSANLVSPTEIGRLKKRSEEREEKYKKLLDEAENEIDMWKDRHAKATKLASNLQAQLNAVGDPTGTALQLEKQRKLIDALEQQIIEMDIEEFEKEEEDRGDLPQYDHSVIQRALLDEDLEGSKLRTLIQSLDCRQCQRWSHKWK